MQTELHIYSFSLLEPLLHDLSSLSLVYERKAISGVLHDWLDKILLNASQLGVPFTSRTYNTKYKYVWMCVYLVLVPLSFFLLVIAGI